MIEIVVVLVLIALAGSIVLPNLTTLYDKIKLRAQEDEILQQLSTLGFSAYNHGRTIRLTDIGESGGSDWIQLPDGWSLSVAHPIVYKHTGFCLGGDISLRIGDELSGYTLTPPHCQPKLPAN